MRRNLIWLILLLALIALIYKWTDKASKPTIPKPITPSPSATPEPTPTASPVSPPSAKATPSESISYTIEPTYYWFTSFQFQMTAGRGQNYPYEARLEFDGHSVGRVGAFPRLQFERLRDTLNGISDDQLKTVDPQMAFHQPYYTLDYNFKNRKFRRRVYGLENKAWEAIDAAMSASPMGEIKKAMEKEARKERRVGAPRPQGPAPRYKQSGR